MKVMTIYQQRSNETINFALEEQLASLRNKQTTRNSALGADTELSITRNDADIKGVLSRGAGSGGAVGL